MNTIIKVDNISKKYHLGRYEPYQTLRDVIARTVNPRNFLNSVKSATKQIDKSEFWALKNISFEVNKGEMLGVIGRNGAGKSTLLKILSRITSPTSGEVRLYGKVASLLEVGTGFSPELTGKENIFLNGTILGMTQREIKSKFDEILAFASVEKFIDTPVKYYSSGMYMRLAFSVAAHLDPDILLVDEVLAVGDAEFQKKCLGKMETITRNEGRTVLFVSHNLIAVQKSCKNTILLDGGEIVKIGPTQEVINDYLNNKTINKGEQSSKLFLKNEFNVGNIRFSGVKVTNFKGSSNIFSNDKLKIVLEYTSDFGKTISDVRVVISVISENSGQTVLCMDSNIPKSTLGNTLEPDGKIICATEEINLSEGNYSLDINFHIQGTSVDLIKGAASFSVTTNINKYDFKSHPDRTISDRVIGYSFKN